MMLTLTRKDKIKSRRKKVAGLLGGKCHVCEKKFGKNFHFHHIVYRDHEKKHSDFTNWYDYQEYVLPIVEKHPKEFALLCKNQHRIIEILKSYTDVNFERLIYLARESRK